MRLDQAARSIFLKEFALTLVICPRSRQTGWRSVPRHSAAQPMSLSLSQQKGTPSG